MPKRNSPSGRAKPSENAVSTFSTRSRQPLRRRGREAGELLQRRRL